MKHQAPSAEQLADFTRLQFVTLGIVALAFVVWEVQDFAASFAAKAMTTQTTLRTTSERNDVRVQQAFKQARELLRVDARLQTESNPSQQTRDAVLVVVADTKSATLEGREQMVKTMQQAFKASGGEELFDVGNAPSASPVPNDTSLLVKRSLRYAALAILLLGLTQLALGWRRSKLPRAALIGIVATVLTIALTMLGSDAALVWWCLVIVGPPIVVIGLIYVLTKRVRTAQSWTEANALITTSKVTVEHHRFAGDTTRVKNMPCVEYEFEVPGKGKVRGDTISLGYGTADNVDVVLKRYPVGATVPVYFDENNPQSSVLEREGPMSTGCLYGTGFGFALIYVTIALSLLEIVSINKALAAALPAIHHPVLVLVTGALGLLALAAGIWNMRHPRKAFPWSQTKGTIVVSQAESFSDTDSSDSLGTRILYRPVIEFSYTVDGHDYRGSSASSAVTMAASKTWADREVARFPIGMEVVVFYDPQRPTQSGLNVNTDITLNGRSSLIVAVILISVACYAASH